MTDTEIIYQQGEQWIWNSDGRLYALPPTVRTLTDAQEFVAAKRQELGYDMNYRLRVGGGKHERG